MIAHLRQRNCEETAFIGTDFPRHSQTSNYVGPEYGSALFVCHLTNQPTAVHYRFRNDDGSESGATYIAAQDTNASITISGNKNVRLRYAFTNPGTLSAAVTYQLQVSHNGGAAATIGSSSSYIQGVVSSNLTDGANTTEQLTLDSGHTYQTKPGVTNNTSATSQSIGITNGTGETEIEWSLVLIASQLANGDTLTFTFTTSGGTDGQYGSAIILTILKPGRRRGGVEWL